jgi:hypothetical protein
MTDPRTARRRLPEARLSLAVAIVAAIGALIACGGPSSSTTAATSTLMPSGSTGSGTSTPASATATPVTGGPGDPQLLPLSTDTAFQQAPPAIQAEWQSYFAQGIITVVPNSTVPYQRPATPQVQNATGGVVDAATAQRWADAVMRQTSWATWAINHNQLQLLYETSSRQAYAGISLPAGANGFQVSGSEFPATMKLVKVPQAAQQLLQIKDQFAFLVTFSASASISSVFPDGHTQPLPDQTLKPGQSYFLVGSLTSKPLLGEVWFGTAAGICDSGEPASVQAMCGG